jgi:hypothetical protein
VLSRYTPSHGRLMAVLELLMRADGGVLSAEYLLDKACDIEADPFTNAVGLVVYTLRKKLGEPQLVRTAGDSGARCNLMKPRQSALLHVGVGCSAGAEERWTLAEGTGHADPDRVHQLLSRIEWDARCICPCPLDGRPRAVPQGGHRRQCRLRNQNGSRLALGGRRRGHCVAPCSALARRACDVRSMCWASRSEARSASRETAAFSSAWCSLATSRS